MTQQTETIAQTGFDWVADERSEILILGSMPGQPSLTAQQYYANPRNAFWPIMQALFQIPLDLSYIDRLERLKQQKIALWDVVRSCKRVGSLDTNIETESVQVNDFHALFKNSPLISRIYFNGAKAEQLYKKAGLMVDSELLITQNFQRLPSTSPAHAASTFEQKLAEWHQIVT